MRSRNRGCASPILVRAVSCLQVREGREAGVPLGGHRAFRERSEALRGGGAQRRLLGEGAPSGPAQVVGLPPRVHVAKPRPVALPLLRQGAVPRRGHGGGSSGSRGRRSEISCRAPDSGEHRRGERERCAEPRPELPLMQRQEGKQDGALADSRRFGGSSVVLGRPPHRAGAASRSLPLARFRGRACSRSLHSAFLLNGVFRALQDLDRKNPGQSTLPCWQRYSCARIFTPSDSGVLIVAGGCWRAERGEWAAAICRGPRAVSSDPTKAAAGKEPSKWLYPQLRDRGFRTRS